MDTTTYFIIASILIWIFYDTFAYLKWGNTKTISVEAFYASKISPGILVAVGFVLGHLFWQVHICG